jgi:hypothetical protein
VKKGLCHLATNETEHLKAESRIESLDNYSLRKSSPEVEFSSEEFEPRLAHGCQSSYKGRDSIPLTLIAFSLDSPTIPTA